MKQYSVIIYYEAVSTVAVEAENEQEAIELAHEAEANEFEIVCRTGYDIADCKPLNQQNDQQLKTE